MAETKILVATQEANFINEISSIVGLKNNMKLGGVCKNVSELKMRLEHTPAKIAIVDIDPDPSYALSELSKVISLYPGTHFAVASSNSNSELILAAMQAGARDFILKKFIKVELDRVLERLLFSIAKLDILTGSVISVFSASGGCGATTVVVNLANELRLMSSKPVLTMDLDSYYSSMSRYLDISGHYGVADILAHEGAIDTNLIKSSATNYVENFDVLPNSANGNSFVSKNIKVDNIIPLLEACKHTYKYTVIDAARVPEGMTELLAATSKAILIVFQMNVKDVKATKATISKLTMLGANPQHIIPLVNRYRKPGLMIELDEIKKVLGSNSLQLISNDYKHVVDSINHGKLLADCAGRSNIRKDFQGLASRIYALAENGTGHPKNIEEILKDRNYMSSVREHFNNLVSVIYDPIKKIISGKR